jgi:hypothetical protein
MIRVQVSVRVGVTFIVLGLDLVIRRGADVTWGKKGLELDSAEAFGRIIAKGKTGTKKSKLEKSKKNEHKCSRKRYSRTIHVLNTCTICVSTNAQHWRR